jgi:hypothetical protein
MPLERCRLTASREGPGNIRTSSCLTARYAARQAHERARTTVDRLQRRMRELSERLDRAAELATRQVAAVLCLANVPVAH